MAKTKPKRKRCSGKEIGRLGRSGHHSSRSRQNPTLAIPIRALSNVLFNERKGMIEMGAKKQARSFFNVGMAKKFMQTILVADALWDCSVRDLTTSLREIYYRTKHTIQHSHENTFDTQDESDPVIEDLEAHWRPYARNCTCGPRTAAAWSGDWCWETTAIGWTVPNWERAGIRCLRSLNPSMSRSVAARRTFCCW